MISDSKYAKMVNLWLPELPNESRCEDEIQSVDDIIIPGTDTSDTEDDDTAYNGYEPLPLGPNDVDINDNSSEDDECDDPITTAPQSVPPIIPIENTLVQEVWSNPTPQCIDIEMDNEKANEVKMAMANFTLPSTSIPDWAANIPEDQWKEQLINRIQHLQENRNKK